VKAKYKGRTTGSDGLKGTDEDYKQLIPGQIYEIEYETGPNEESYIVVEGIKHWCYGFTYWTLKDFLDEWFLIQEPFEVL